MNQKSLQMLLFCLALLLLCPVEIIYAEYIEGIDTTDENGYGLDSAFNIGPQYQLTGQKLACYFGPSIFSGFGAFMSVFDEIHQAADSASFYPGWSIIRPGFCFVVQHLEDSCFSKVMVIGRFDSNRYIYKYGTNTSPNNRMLIKPDYDFSVLYKPNNLYYRTTIENLFTWDPPLPNDNHLQGYILFIQKKGVAIDTSANINQSQWDSVGFTDSTRIIITYNSQGEYFNLVAVYAEGKSEFLKGWGQLYWPSSINITPRINHDRNTISINKTRNVFSIKFNQQLASSLAIYNTIGKAIAYYSNCAEKNIYWNTSQQCVPTGLYLLRAEFPDRSVITQPFTVTR
jgi:hypothetical protein